MQFRTAPPWRPQKSAPTSRNDCLRGAWGLALLCSLPWAPDPHLWDCSWLNGGWESSISVRAPGWPPALMGVRREMKGDWRNLPFFHVSLGKGCRVSWITWHCTWIVLHFEGEEAWAVLSYGGSCLFPCMTTFVHWTWFLWNVLDVRVWPQSGMDAAQGGLSPPAPHPHRALPETFPWGTQILSLLLGGISQKCRWQGMWG